MNRVLIGLGAVVVALSIFYFMEKKKDETVSAALTYGLGIAACLFISILIYNLMQHFKKK